MGKIKILNESLGKVKSLAGLKRYLKDGGRLKLVSHAYNTSDGKTHNVLAKPTVKVPTKVLSNGVDLKDSEGRATRLDFGGADNWKFNGDHAEYTDGFMVMKYVLVDA